MRTREQNLPDVSDWPHTTCTACGVSKINGLFTPLQLKSKEPQCLRCVGEVSSKHRKDMRAQWGLGV